MKKKTLKIFANSFIVSLFAIWVVNELFLVAPTQSNRDLVIPEQSIVLFLQSDSAAALQGLAQPIKSAALAEPVMSVDEDIKIDKDLFHWNGTTEKGYAITSVEDVADIPLEYAATQNVRRPLKRPAIMKTADSSPASAPKKQQPAVDPSENAVKPSEKAAVSNALPPLLAQKSDTPVVLAQTDEDAVIPLQKNFAQSVTGEIEVVDKAPQTQIAMAGDLVVTGTVAIEKENREEAAAEKIWHPMEAAADDNPWVVAKGMKYPNNKQVIEDFEKVSESDIENILNKPESLEEDGEVQVSEMVKNILIPIPEDIMNDKNLTPQLVSPKKNSQIAVADEENTEENGEGKKGGILKSIASMFGTGDDGDDTTATEPEKVKSKKKKRGLFSSFGEEKSSFKKILPAEMKLSFQPGRAEISGQTLRWIEAFANKAIEDDSVILQIRIDQTSSFELQQKRLNLLHNILTNKGVGYHKIDTVLTSREPNSFIIRTLKINDNVNSDTLRANNRKTLNYQSW